MRLQRLELFGFKTFADATEFRFDEGITAIIGPNGSGKSNCADALQWVLAERRLSAIRAAEASDLIFAGSEGRRPLGYAEVILTIDNADGSLPLEMAEVAVGRRVYRSGDNEYRLNGKVCRRKDVVDLFLDTGLGRPAFSVISQREADAILSLDPLDRRRMIDEVAGVERYRTQRDETLRRLADVATSLTRVDDLTAELRLQVEPLAEQARTATEFLALRTRADSLRLSLLVKDHQLAARRAERLRDEIAGLRGDLVALETEQAEFEAAEQAARLELTGLEERLTSARGDSAEARLALERHESANALATEQRDNLRARLAEAARAETARVELAAAEAARDEAEAAETQRLAAEAEQHQATRAAAAATAQTAREAEARARQAAEAARGALAEHDRTQAQQRARGASAAEALATAQARLAALTERDQQSAARLAAAEAAQAEAETASAAAQTDLTAREAARRATAEALVEADARLAAAREQSAADSRQLATNQGRLAALEAAARAYEGSTDAVRAVLRARDQGRLAGEFVPLLDVLRVAEGYEAAVEAVLGAHAQDILCRTPAEARAGAELLAGLQVGRATLRPVAADAPAAAAAPDTLGAVVSAVEGWAGALAQLLPAAVPVVADLTAAVALRPQTDATLPIATRDGFLLHPDGALTGGRSTSKATSLVARRREIDRLTAEVAAGEAAAAEQQAAQAALVRAQADAQAAHRAAGTDLDAARRALASAERARHEAQAATARAAGEAGRLAEQAAALRAEAERATTQLAAADAAAAASAEQAETLTAARTAADAAWSAAGGEREAAEADLATAREAAARIESRLHTLREAVRGRAELRARAAAEAERLAADRTTWQTRLDQLEAAESGLAAEGERLHAATQATAARVDELRTAHQACAETMNQATERARTARGRAHAASEALHRAELRQTQAETELQLHESTLDSDYPGLTMATAEAQAEPIANRAEAAAELQTTREAMAALGEVNLGAPEESRRVGERLEFYAREQADLARARDDLLTVMADLDAVSRERLARAFDDVNREFDALFRRVFGPNGHAALEWTDPDNFLESGVEVLVEMPGKRTQNLNLLSGGERAMTTITLLLSMFRVKPTPFCLLDELDASLDEHNLRQYRNLLTEFAQLSQFIVITHNPETTRAADTLYGITMAEPGVSRAYSYKPPASTEN